MLINLNRMTGENSKIFKILSYALSDANVFLPEEQFASDLVKDCLELYSRDNICTTIDNSKGALCSTYPVHLIIPLKQKIVGKNDNYYNDNHDESRELVDLVQRGRFARTRGRFPAPVLLIGEKFVCRSSTLARSPEIYTRTGYQYFMQGESPAPVENGNSTEQQNGISSNQSMNGLKINSSLSQNGHTNGTSVLYNKNNGKQQKPAVVMHSNGSIKKQKMLNSMHSVNVSGQNKEWLLDKMRNTDIDLLHVLRVNVICDFMVEKKKVKYGMSVTSSEKVDREKRYSDFDLLCIPYPGCEFFADYTNNNYTGVGLKFDWNQHFVDAELQVPDSMTNIRGVQWKEYMHWDLVKLTQNYLKLLLNCLLRPCSSGMLLHCISGWDRTPLFVSLLRLSLWADGLIHQSLSAEEVVYLTLAYDWLLFSHQFADRIDKNEEIMHFCFDFLKYISSAEYSLLPNVSNQENPFAFVDSNMGAEDMFLLENDMENCNGAENARENQSNELQANGVNDNELNLNAPGYTQPCKHDKLVNLQSDHPKNPETFNFQEVETCLNCLIDNISEENKHQNCDNEVESYQNSTTSPLKNEAPVMQLIHETAHQGRSSPVAILPLNCSESGQNFDDGQNNNVSETNGVSSHGIYNGSEGRQKIVPSVFSPRSALSSSFETAKTNMNLVHQTTRLSHLQKGLSNSLNFSNDDVSKYPTSKSDPISVPSHCMRSSASSDRLNNGYNSTGSSGSTAAVTAEPGSSWQMISSPLPQDSNYILDVNSSTPSGAPSSRHSSFTSSYNGAAEIESLKLKLERRKERLDKAHNAMIPAYSAVVQQQKQRQQEHPGGTLSALMGHLVGFVKRS